MMAAVILPAAAFPPPASSQETDPRKILAKGINLSHWLSQHDLNKNHLETYDTEADFRLIASLGFTHVRLPVDTSLLVDLSAEPSPPGE